MRVCWVSEEAWWCCVCCGWCWGPCPPPPRTSPWPTRRWCSSCWSCGNLKSLESEVCPRDSLPPPGTSTILEIVFKIIDPHDSSDDIPEEVLVIFFSAKHVWEQHWESFLLQDPTPDTSWWSQETADHHNPWERSAVLLIQEVLLVCLVYFCLRSGQLFHQAEWSLCSSEDILNRREDSVTELLTTLSMIPASSQASSLHNQYLTFRGDEIFCTFWLVQ